MNLGKVLILLELAKSLSLSKAFTSVAAGVILKYFSLKIEGIEKYFNSKLSEEIINKNIVPLVKQKKTKC